MENKYKNGEVVFDRIRPGQKLIIRSYSNGIYYCMPHENRSRGKLVYFERDLTKPVSDMIPTGHQR